MSIFYFLKAFLLVLRIRKRLRTNIFLYPKWRNKLNLSLWIIVILFIGTWFIADPYQDLCGASVLLAMALYGQKEEDIKPYKVVFQASYPLIGVGYVSGIVKIFFGFFYDTDN